MGVVTVLGLTFFARKCFPFFLLARAALGASGPFICFCSIHVNGFVKGSKKSDSFTIWWNL